MVALKRAVVCGGEELSCLTSESVEGTSLSLQGVDDIHGGDGLPLGVLGVGDGITDHVLQEHLQHTAGLLVDESADTLDTTTTGQTADGGLGDALDVIPQHFPVTLGATLSESLASFTTSRHVAFLNATSRMASGSKCALYKWWRLFQHGAERIPAAGHKL